MMSRGNHSDFPANREHYMTEAELAAITALYAVILLAILLGNGLIIVSFVVNKRLRTVTNRLVVGLSVSDILVGLVSIPCWMFIYIRQYYKHPVSPSLLQFYAATDIFLGSACILQLSSISIERCHAVVRPFQHRTLSKRAFYAMMFVPWCYAGVVAALQPIQYGLWTKVYTILVTTTCFFTPLILITIAYSCIVKFVRSKLRQKLREHQHHRSVYRREIRLAATVALITLMFVIEWLPLFVMTVMATYYPAHLPSPLWTDRLLKLVKWMHYSNSALDPFVYAYRNPDIITTFRYLIFRFFCCHNRLPEMRQPSSGVFRPSSGVFRACSGVFLTSSGSNPPTCGSTRSSLRTGRGQAKRTTIVCSDRKSDGPGNRAQST